MHKLNVLILGSSSFISTLNELKTFLKFNPITKNSDKDYQVILFNHEALINDEQSTFINKSELIKIFAGKKSQTQTKYDDYLELPTSLKEINNIIENAAAKKKYSKNSSIKVKDYVLNKNEKKLLKLEEFIILTEKEVQLIELFLKNKKPISKDNILNYVWNYSSEADTHTVETHIYRLRKKITDKFRDEKFILNNKDGYYL